jgi:hypothetical protein
MSSTKAVPSDAALRKALEKAFAEVGLAAARDVVRRPSEYTTSFPLEELDVVLVDGNELRLVGKRLDWAALEEAGRVAKPEFLHDPLREPAVYAHLLAPRGLGPRYCGSAVDVEADGFWLFVERVEGRELYQLGDLEPWRAAAGWLAEMHGLFAGDLQHHAECGRLIDCDEAYYRRWLARAREFAVTMDGERAQGVNWLAARYDAVVEILLDLPRTVLHGEFYASNVLVGADASRPRVYPVDWEMAAAGPGLLDLAALVSGDWREEEREEIGAAYRAVAGAGASFPEQLAAARLHLAVQWLGWAPPEWLPPAGQRHDWLTEALALAERLGL